MGMPAALRHLFVSEWILMCKISTTGLHCMRQARNFQCPVKPQIQASCSLKDVYQAALKGHEKCVAELLKIRADIGIKDKQSKTALDLAKDSNLIKYLQV